MLASSVPTGIKIRRRFLHVKREARTVHANLLNGQVTISLDSKSDQLCELAGVAGLRLPPTSQ